MKKLFLMFLFLTAGLSAQTTYYVGVTASGSGNGSSWANKDDWATFNHAGLSPGDIVYVDGGASDSLLYDDLALQVSASGSAGNRITYRRGADAGHNGRPVFNYSSQAYDYTLMANTDYVTIDGLEFYSKSGSDGSLQTCEVNGDSVTLINCKIVAPMNKCVRIDGGNNNKILNCELYFGYPVSGNPDGIWLGGNGHNLEVAYSKIVCLNTGSGAHKDNIQTYLWQSDDTGTTSIHHNFFWSATSGIYANTVFELSSVGGTWIFYNNIIVYGGSDAGRAFYLGNCYEGLALVDSYVFNNTFYTTSDTKNSISFTYPATAQFKNNLVYAVSGDEPDNAYKTDDTFFDGTLDFDYNLIITNGDVAFAYTNISDDVCTGYSPGYQTVSQWQSTHGLDVNSLVYSSEASSGVDFIGSSMPSLNPADYALTETSTGVGDGEDLSSIFTSLGLIQDDYDGNPRTGTWDIGAFEFGTASVDSVPTFSFTALTSRELNTEYIATSPITGTDTVCHFWTTTSASFKINYNGTYSTAMKTADPDNGADTIYVKNTTGGSYSTMYTETIVGGGNHQNFNVTTKSAPVAGNETILRDSSGKIIKSSTGKIIKVK